MVKSRWRSEQIMYIMLLLIAMPCNGKDSSGMDNDMVMYAPKSCKFNIIPTSLSSRAYTAYTGEVHVHDVFGLPSTVKRHVMQLDVPTGALLTLQAEVHRDTPTTLSVDAYRRGEVGKAASRVLFGKNLLGSGGDETKAFLHGRIEDDVKEVDIVFELISVEVAARQVDGRISETRCWPVRLDLSAVPLSRTTLHWPSSCPERNSLPPPLSGSIVSGQVVALTDKGLGHEIQENGKPYSFRLSDERPWQDYGRSLWSVILEVPPRLHRFVRLFLRASFRFPSGPLQLVIELFDIKDTPDGTALAPKCAMGCLGGVPVHNGQIIDHAMPTGFRYRLWLLAASLPEWTAALPQRGRHCLEFDFDYKIKFEERMTPFEVGPQAWLCEFARLPSKIVQLPHATATEKLNSVNELVAGRTIWIRDRFGFPPDEVADMEHTIVLEISEPCVFRATTHHSDGVDVFVALRDKAGTARACKTMKHPGPVPRQTIFCVLQPGTYNLIFFADYPLGGLHPCSDFFAQVALRPLAMSNDGQTRQCIESSTDLGKLEVAQVSAATVAPRWKAIKVPITFSDSPATFPVWSQEVVVTEEDSAQRLYLRLVMNSDYVSSDLRFQVKYEGKYIADTQVTAHGYADMIGPLDPGDYTVEMYYVTGTGSSKDTKLCSTTMVDLRLVSRAKYENRTGMEWLCTSTRVPPPDLLTPQPDEQVLIDAEYVIPELGQHAIIVKFNSDYLLRLKTSSAEADFRIELRRRGEVLGQGVDALEYAVSQGTYTLRLVANVNGGAAKTCPTFLLMLLLQPRNSVPVCPWAPSSTDQSEASEAQRRAEDHLGNVKLDLVPKELTKEVNFKPPTSFWMSPDMNMKFDLETRETTAVRIDVSVQPAFLPLEVTLRKVRDSGKIEPPVATATWTETRLLLKDSDVPKGKYVVEISNPRKYLLAPGVDGSSEDLKNLCAHVTISAEVGISSKQAVNSMRSELLDLPDLLAVQPFPQTFNNVGWFASPMLPVIGTQVYTFGDGQGGNRKATLRLEEKAVVRVVCEPADLSNAEITAELQRDGQTLTVSDNLGQLIGELDAGSYTIELKPQASAPFLVTLGIATESRIKEDLALLDSRKPCSSKFPVLASGIDFRPQGWTMGPTLIRLKPSFLDTEGLLAKIPINLQASSILYMEVGSALPLDLIRIALQVPEGLWVGEQRGLRNSLEIELPPGKYTVNIAQPKPSRITVSRDRCLDFTVLIRATPVNPDARADTKEAADADVAASGGSISEEGKVQELASREESAVESAPCFSMGTVPLPLDISDPEGGSKILGGPIDADGRLLIRTHAMLTDMHDGRKKMFLGTNGRKLQMKVGVIMAGYARLSLASSLTFTVQPSEQKQVLDPLEVWNNEEGWERVYILEGSNGVWISFHHGHRERGESACLHFGLELEIHPYEDAAKMIDCQGPVVNQALDPQEMFPESLDVNQAEDESRPFRFAKPLTFLRQVQRGFLKRSRFALRSTSWVGVEVGYNFFSSHAEMDIVRAESPSGNSAIATSEMDFLHNSSSLLNTRLHVGIVLEPGEYIIRVADDHYAAQLGSSSTACFPFNFEVRIVPQRAAPTVVSVHPHPSVPIPRGVDLVVTLRFSEPPAGNVQDVVKCIYLGGVQAASGGSLNAMEGRFATNKKSTIVQATVGEGHLVWVIGWSAQVVAKMTTAKLRIVGLKSNETQKLFRFNPPTYSIVEVPSGTPWSGARVTESASPRASSSRDEVQPEETVAKTGSAADVSEDAGAIKAEKGSESNGASKSVGEIGGVRLSSGAAVTDGRNSVQGEPKPESSAGQNTYAAKDDAGEIHVEGKGGSSQSQSAPSPRPSPRPAATVADYPRRELPSEDLGKDEKEEDLSSGVQAQEYNPMDGSEKNTGDTSDGSDKRKGTSSAPEGGSAIDLGNAESAAVAAAGAVPVGYRSVLIVCGVSVGLFFLAFCGPRIQAALTSKQASTPSARFRDIGARTSEEEIGLVSAADRWGGEEDML